MGDATSKFYDKFLIIAVLSLMILGLFMVTSSSMDISLRQHGRPFYYVLRHLIYLAISLIAFVLILRIPTSVWQEAAFSLFFLTFILLIVVLIPSVGKTVNGSRRWLSLGSVRFQVSEFAKFTTIIYLGHYLSKYLQFIHQARFFFLKPLGLIASFVLLLIKEPDLGAAIIILSTSLGMIFLAVPPLIPFLLVLSGMGLVSLGLIMGSTYRMARLVSFFNPWAQPFSSGYQLIQSLIACGRGGITGLGLGESVQKLFYLPESHTDFIFAVLVEELGLLGGLLVLILFSLIVFRAFYIGWQCMKKQHMFNGFVAYGIGIHLGGSALVNIGVNIGLLPTKGLTLPLISYGGNSLLVSFIMLGVLFRIYYELRCASYSV